jgi:hypothetical protein
VIVCGKRNEEPINCNKTITVRNFFMYKKAQLRTIFSIAVEEVPELLGY